MFDRILIANRGEIACRIARTARRLGVETVAVYSDADRDALHVKLCDRAIHIGPAAAGDSYLNAERILAAARDSGAQAIHPGYGFLSENAGFARACEEAGLVFIGPPAAAIEAMGSKIEAKRLMAAAGVPLVPGVHGDDQSPAAMERAAREIGWPLLIKASAGGGGKGMRVVSSPDGLAAALAAARRESMAAFGDDRLLLERYLEAPRHVELQVFADRHGHCIHLFERDCSIQRRLQKIIEEAPAPKLDPELRRRMGAAAVAAARAVDYVGAGTVEFLLDRDGAFYFMEMNTRLQVEHPVTEMITGQDLVEWQLRVAAGEPLPLSQEELAIDGHAMEARIYAENPEQGFLPATGVLHHLRFPDDEPGVRIDSGVEEGSTIGVHYDPMIAKLIVHGADRDQARRRLRRALARCELAGVATNVSFLFRVSGLAAFAGAELDTRFIERHQAELAGPGGGEVPPQVAALAALAELLWERRDGITAQQATADPWSPWALADGWRLNHGSFHRLAWRLGESRLEVVAHYREGGFVLELPGGECRASARFDPAGRLQAELDGRRVEAGVARQGRQLTLYLDGGSWQLLREDPRADALAAEAADSGLCAPMPGVVTAVYVDGGEAVAKGDALMVVEAMKMEHSIIAPADGVVAELHFRAGDQVEEGDELIRLEPAGDPAP